MIEKHRIAVVGLGSCGLAALKNLREAGFNAVGFESNSYVSGLWQYTDDTAQVSVLETTVANISKSMGCYTDFPYPDDVPEFAAAKQTAQYLKDYAAHFGLLEHSRLNTRVKHVAKTQDGWSLDIKDISGTRKEIFDRVVICVGLQVQSPKLPQFEGMDTFTGELLHSNAYKRAAHFGGKKVVVVGLGNTGPDTATDLIGHASEIWMSHRRGNAILSRWTKKHQPGGHVLSLRLLKIGGLCNSYLPRLWQHVSVMGLQRMQKAMFDIRPEWNLGPIPLPAEKVPTLNEELVPALHEGKIHLKPGLASIKGDVLTFSDDSTLSDVDAIICCTGFRSDFSYMDPAADPTRNTRKDWASMPGSNGRPLPRLYQGIFSLDFPDSLAFLGTSPLSPQAFLNYDISSMALAQIWLGNSPLPSLSEMNAHVDAQHEAVCKISKERELANTNLRNNWGWYQWCDEAAGIGLVRRMGYGLDGWKFWSSDRGLCKLVMDGIVSPHMFRLFDEGKRKTWDGAREALEKVNRAAGRL